jgi:hypothetical protein
LDEALNHGNEKCAITGCRFHGNSVHEIVLCAVTCQVQQEFHHPPLGVDNALGFKVRQRPGLAGWSDERQLHTARRANRGLVCAH